MARKVEKDGVARDRRVQELSIKFRSSQKLLIALGDESRQHIILAMMSMEHKNGSRAVDIAEKTNLSRPAVSHHLQILKDAGIIKSRKEGTKIYYYFDPDMKTMNALIDALRLAIDITRSDQIEKPDMEVFA